MNEIQLIEKLNLWSNCDSRFNKQILEREIINFVISRLEMEYKIRKKYGHTRNFSPCNFEKEDQYYIEKMYCLWDMGGFERMGITMKYVNPNRWEDNTEYEVNLSELYFDKNKLEDDLRNKEIVVLKSAIELNQKTLETQKKRLELLQNENQKNLTKSITNMATK